MRRRSHTSPGSRCSGRSGWLRRAPQAFVLRVQALRETSVVIAVAAGALLLGERVGRMRALGTAAVVTGVVARALA